MKSYTDLFEKILSFENLYLASRKAEKGKRFRSEVAAFNARRAENLLEMQKLLREGSYPFGTFRTKKIYQPKPRIISAAPYPDRVVHHAVINIIGPLFEQKFIFDSYANQIGKGTHAALNRCTQFARRFKYVLQLDIRKYFPSIDHEILLTEIAKTIRCRKTMALITSIVRTSNLQEPADFHFPGDSLFTPPERRKGLPIGNLTSQFFANVYLNPFDHFVKETLGVRGYIRYVDDALLFGDEKSRLWQMKAQCRDFLQHWRLLLHPKKAVVYPVQQGIPFLGFRVFPEHRLLLKGSVQRARKRLRSLSKDYGRGRISFEQVDASVQAWIGHVRHGDTWGLRKKLFGEYRFTRAGA